MPLFLICIRLCFLPFFSFVNPCHFEGVNQVIPDRLELFLEGGACFVARCSGPQVDRII